MKKFQFLRKQIGLFDYVFVQAHCASKGKADRAAWSAGKSGELQVGQGESEVGL